LACGERRGTVGATRALCSVKAIEGVSDMATTPRAAAAAAGRRGAETGTAPEDLEAEIARLREDVARLAEQLARTGEHSYSAAMRAASDGAEQLRAKGEAAVDALKSNASD